MISAVTIGIPMIAYAPCSFGFRSAAGWVVSTAMVAVLMVSEFDAESQEIERRRVVWVLESNSLRLRDSPALRQVFVIA